MIIFIAIISICIRKERFIFWAIYINKIKWIVINMNKNQINLLKSTKISSLDRITPASLI